MIGIFLPFTIAISSQHVASGAIEVGGAVLTAVAALPLLVVVAFGWIPFESMSVAAVWRRSWKRCARSKRVS